MKQNIYSIEELGIKEPKGGFINYGWYEGRNYYRGTFSDQGMIHPMLRDDRTLKDVIEFVWFKIKY